MGAAVILLAGCSTSATQKRPRTQLRGFDHFEQFERSNSDDRLVLLSPRIDVQPWDELVLSWNAQCPAGTALTVEARAFDGANRTRFYTLGSWTWTEGAGRTSMRNETDAEATMETDTLIARRQMSGAQVRLTLSGTNGSLPALKLLTLSFLNSAVAPETNSPNRAAWGKILDVPERSQLGYPGGKGWCSPTAVSMILAYWSRQLNRAELDVSVPEAAHCVHDFAYRGTGNWAFNMAYAGSFDGMRAHVARLENLRQVEDYIAAGVPVALSVSFDLLNGKEKDQNNGHLIVVVGFTKEGDVVVNDPWPNPKKENRVRKTFARRRIIAAWQRSKQTVYVIVPNGVSIRREHE
jgi:uncharacterized protein YvpB